MSDIVQGSVGPEGSYDVSFSGGALVLTLKYGGAQASANLVVTLSAAQLVGALAGKLTNQTEKDLLIGLESIIAAIP